MATVRAQDRPLTFAYADPPYLGMGRRYADHPDAYDWDDPETYRVLIKQMSVDYPAGWALSASSVSLQTLLPMCPDGIRVAAWVKPWAAYKRSVRVAYTWEPVIVCGGRKSSLDGAGVNRDYLAEPMTMKKGLTGAKPERFCRWVLDLLGWRPDDTVDDLYPGTGVFARVILAAQASPGVLK